MRKAKSNAQKCIDFLETLEIPEGPSAGKLIKLAPFQKDFVRGALDPATNVAVLSIGRGNGKSALAAGIALGALLGIWDDQPRREIVIAARTAEQSRIAFDFVLAFLQCLPNETQLRTQYRKSPRLELILDGEHMVKAISADGRSALGSAPNLVLLDERGHWRADRGDGLEHALLSGLGKRGGKALIISTSADSDAHAFSQWLDNPMPGVYIQEHRAQPGLPADDVESIIEANPGAEHGIGAPIEWLTAQARTAIRRGGSNLSAFRLYNRNERISGEDRDVLLTIDEYLRCETSEPPERVGDVVVGIDLGSSASMSAASFYWPESGRLEALATYPSKPGLLERGASDGVGDRYHVMNERGELSTLGDRTVPAAEWLLQVMKQIDGCHVKALILDRFKQSEMGDAIDKAQIRAPVVWRGTGWRDGGEDCERFRRAAYDGLVKTAPSLLLRSAFGDAICLRDPANNLKLAKARSNGRIDAVSATVLAVAEGVRRTSRPQVKRRAPQWV